MGQFMTDFSALSYLQKGDTQSATLILRSSAERSLITAHTYGTPTLDSFRRDASSRWFAEYAKLRKKLPPASRGPENEEFDREVDDILAEATKDISMRNNSVRRTP